MNATALAQVPHHPTAATLPVGVYPAKPVLRSMDISDPFAMEVVTLVAADFGISVEDMLARSRRYDALLPRLAAMYFARLLSSCSLPELGRLFGGRRHTTVLRAFRRCQQMMEQDSAWRARMDGMLVDLVEQLLSRH